MLHSSSNDVQAPAEFRLLRQQMHAHPADIPAATAKPPRPDYKHHKGQIMKYRVGLPFWRQFAKAGAQLTLRIDVQHDKESGCYIATSPDLDGLTVEAKSLDMLVPEVDDCVDMLIESYLHQAPKRQPFAAMHIGHAACA